MARREAGDAGAGVVHTGAKLLHAWHGDGTRRDVACLHWQKRWPRALAKTAPLELIRLKGVWLDALDGTGFQYSNHAVVTLVTLSLRGLSKALECR